jgi:chaperonin GroEL
VVLQRVVDGEGNYGYNAASGEYGDMVAMGVLDPRKVSRTALQNAASIASPILTTDCMIAQVSETKPKEEMPE